MESIAYEILQCFNCTQLFMMSVDQIYSENFEGTVKPVCPHCGSSEESDTHGHLTAFTWLTDVRIVPAVSIDELKTCMVCDSVFNIDKTQLVMELDGEDVGQPLDTVRVCDKCYQREVNAPGWGWSNNYAPLEEYEWVEDPIIGGWGWKRRV